MHRPDGKYILDVAIRKADPSAKLNCSRMVPFPKLGVPIIVAKFKSCSDPATISAADAVFSFINTMILFNLKKGLPKDLYSLDIVCLPEVLNNRTSFS